MLTTMDTDTATTTLETFVGPVTVLTQGTRLAGVFMERDKFGPGQGRPDSGFLADVLAQLEAYFAGDLRSFDLPLHFAGTAFQHRVWTALCDIPYGETESYGELAARIGQPTASRAVGLANGRNPISIVVPCHRVIGAKGKLVGYAGGLDRKARLLAFERGDSLLL